MEATQKFHNRSVFRQRYLILFLAVVCFVLVCCQFAAAQMTFQHPGVLVSRAQLDFIKAQVNAKVDPIYTEFLNAQKSSYGSLTYSPQGPPSGGVIQCGSFSSPDIGCTLEDEDGTAAYTQALLYWITGNNTYGQNAIKILNAYGHNLKSYTDSNGPLQAAWGSSKWARAAEIIRYSNAGWSAADAQTFGTMMTNAMLPNLINGSSSNGNWELSMIEGMIGIAVYNEDANLFNQAVTFWHQRVPAYFYYFPIDGPNPVPPPRGSLNWNGQTVFNASVNGVAQETCRDFGHTEFGIAATIAAAETAHIQGIDLYGSEKPRLEAALEFHAHYLLGNTVPSSVCGGKVTLASRPTFEIGYNEYHNRLGDTLPDTLNWLTSTIRKQSVEVDHHMMVFETLSHGADAGSSAPQPDFSLTASPSSQTITAGNSASFTISVAPINSFTGSVALAVSGLPSGASSSFTPSSISGGSGSSTLSISTGSTSTPAGNYTLTITGTSGTTSHTATVLLTVNAPPDFSVTATPASQTVIAGNSTSYSVSIGALNGFNASVALSVSGAPAGVTAALNPTSVTGSGSSTLSVSTTSSAVLGTATLTITGTSGSLTHSVNVTLVINPPPDFSLSATPGSQTVIVGNATSYTATISALNGFSGSVALSATGLPSGATASFTPSSVSGSGSSTVTITTSSSTLAGTYQLTITGTSGSLVHSASVTLIVNPQPAPDFSLTASPGSQTVTAGNGSSYTATVSALNGFTGSVALSVSGAPAGVTATLNPTSVTGAGTSTLSITTSTSATVGTFTLTITGTSGSLTHSTGVTLIVTAAPVCVSTTTNGPWQDTAFTNQTGTFTVTFNATPSASPINAVIGLSAAAAGAYTDLAAIARFNPSGNIDARSGGSYIASTIPYSGGVSYHFRMVVNIPAHTYSLFVTAPGGAEQTVGSNLAFRTEQNTVTHLSWWGAFSGAGSETVCSFTLQ